jgi:hypothetical protein
MLAQNGMGFLKMAPKRTFNAVYSDQLLFNNMQRHQVTK